MFKFLKNMCGRGHGSSSEDKKDQHKCGSCGSESGESCGCSDGEKSEVCSCGSGKDTKECCGK